MAFCVQTKTFAIPESQRLTLSRPLPRNPGGPPCLSSRASGASRGISNPEPLLFGGRSFGLLSKSDTMTKEYLNTEQLAVGASRPVEGMRRNQRLSAALRRGPGAAAPGREGVLKG